MKITQDDSSLFTDLYEFTMCQGYLEKEHTPRATFDLFFRNLPENRGYIVAAGLEQAVGFIQNLKFSEEALEYLKGQGFRDTLLDFLRDFEFSGDVRAVPEGTVVFPNEPVMEVTAQIQEAQILETFLINQVTFQSMIATKASRVVEAADGRNIVDFGSRRAHGTDAGLKAARASYIGGAQGTSNVAAGKKFGIPVFGTMAHSWIESYPDEKGALKEFAEIYGEDSVLLIDTYDTVEGAKKAIEIAEELRIRPRGVRLDSGNIVKLSKEVRRILDEEGYEDVDIFASGGLDEYKIKEFVVKGGFAGGFGVGTKLVTSGDAPSIEGVYKLMAAEEDGEMEPQMKLSKGKVTYPGQKQFWRFEEGGKYTKDVLGLRDEEFQGEKKMVSILENGRPVYELPELGKIRERCEREVSKLPKRCRKIRGPEKYNVKISQGLKDTMKRLEEKLKKEM